MTGHKVNLEPAFFRFQLELSIEYGEVYTAGVGGNIDSVALIFAPGQDFVVECVFLPSHDSGVCMLIFIYSENTTFQPSHDFVTRLSPEMQMWWISHVR